MLFFKNYLKSSRLLELLLVVFIGVACILEKYEYTFIIFFLFFIYLVSRATFHFIFLEKGAIGFKVDGQYVFMTVLIALSLILSHMAEFLFLKPRLQYFSILLVTVYFIYHVGIIIKECERKNHEL